MITAINAFKEFMEIELKWNGGEVQLADNIKAYQDEFKDPVDQVFIYTCLPGSSVKKELRAAIKKYGYEDKLQIASAYNTRRDFRHGYYLGFKK